MELSSFEKRVVARTFKADSGLGKSALAVLRLWIVATLFSACYFADHYLLLVWYYGFLRVHKEGLHLTYSPSPESIEDYVVSNGDHLSKVDSFVGLPLAVGVWLALIFVGYLTIKYLSHLTKRAVYRKTLKKIYDA